jgi:hypothetical protein
MRFSSLCKTDMPISVSSCLSDLLRRILTERWVHPRGAGVEGNPALAAGDTGLERRTVTSVREVGRAEFRGGLVPPQVASFGCSPCDS